MVDFITSMLSKVADVIAIVMICGRWEATEVDVATSMLIEMADVIAKAADVMANWEWVYKEQLADFVARVADGMAT